MLTALLLAASKASVLESERVECVRDPLIVTPLLARVWPSACL